LIIKAIQK